MYNRKSYIFALKGYSKSENRLQLAACANQDPLEATTGETRNLREVVVNLSL